MKLNIIKWFHQFVPKSTKEKRSRNDSDCQTQEKFNQNEFAPEKECTKEDTLITPPTNDILCLCSGNESMTLQSTNEVTLVEQTLETSQPKTEIPQTLLDAQSLNIENSSPNKKHLSTNVTEKSPEIINEHLSVISENSQAQLNVASSEVQPNIVKSSWKYLSSVFIKMKTTILPVTNQPNTLTGLPDSNADSLTDKTDKVPKILDTINNLDVQNLEVQNQFKTSLPESNQACNDLVDQNKPEILLQINGDKYDTLSNSKSVSHTNLNDVAKLSPKNNLSTMSLKISTDSLNVDSASRNTVRSILKHRNTEVNTYYSMEKLNDLSQEHHFHNGGLNDSINVDLSSSGGSSIKVRSILKRRDEEDTHYSMDKLNNRLSPREQRRERRHSSVTFLEPESVHREDFLDMRYKELSLSANHKSTVINKKKKVTARKHNIGKYL